MNVVWNFIRMKVQQLQEIPQSGGIRKREKRKKSVEMSPAYGKTLSKVDKIQIQQIQKPNQKIVLEASGKTK